MHKHTQVAVKYATEHRCGVRLRGPNLTDCIIGTDPLKDNLPLLKAIPLKLESGIAIRRRMNTHAHTFG